MGRIEKHAFTSARGPEGGHVPNLYLLLFIYFSFNNSQLYGHNFNRTALGEAVPWIFILSFNYGQFPPFGLNIVHVKLGALQIKLRKKNPSP